MYLTIPIINLSFSVNDCINNEITNFSLKKKGHQQFVNISNARVNWHWVRHALNVITLWYRWLFSQSKSFSMEWRVWKQNEEWQDKFCVTLAQAFHWQEANTTMRMTGMAVQHRPQWPSQRLDLTQGPAINWQPLNLPLSYPITKYTILSIPTIYTSSTLMTFLNCQESHWDSACA